MRLYAITNKRDSLYKIKCLLKMENQLKIMKKLGCCYRSSSSYGLLSIASSVSASSVSASSVRASSVRASPPDATTVDATTVDATSPDATTVDATSPDTT